MVVNWKVKNECVSTVFLENKSSYMFESSVVLTHPLSQVRMPILEDLYNIIMMNNDFAREFSSAS